MKNLCHIYISYNKQDRSIFFTWDKGWKLIDYLYYSSLLGFSIIVIFNTPILRVLARIPKLAGQKFFWEWPNICVGMVAPKVFWDVNRNCSYKTHVLER